MSGFSNRSDEKGSIFSWFAGIVCCAPEASISYWVTHTASHLIFIGFFFIYFEFCDPFRTTPIGCCTHSFHSINHPFRPSHSVKRRILPCQPYEVHQWRSYCHCVTRRRSWVGGGSRCSLKYNCHRTSAASDWKAAFWPRTSCLLLFKRLSFSLSTCCSKSYSLSTSCHEKSENWGCERVGGKSQPWCSTETKTKESRQVETTSSRTVGFANSNSEPG